MTDIFFDRTNLTINLGINKMKRKVSEGGNSDGQGEDIACSFDDVMVLVNNRQIDRLNEALEKIENINLRNDDSLLMRACRLGEEDGVRALLFRGADVSLVSRYTGHTALSLACLHGYESIVKLLVEYGAAPDFNHGRSPLVEACIGNHPAVVEYLLGNRAQIDQTPRLFIMDSTCSLCNNNNYEFHNHVCINSLLLACQNGCLDLVRLLIQRGARIDIYFKGLHSDYRGFSPLTFASKGYHWDVVKLLVENGANINDIIGGDSSKYHLSPLMYASIQGDVGVVRWLLGLSADINQVIARIGGVLCNYSPLYLATHHENLDVVKIILEHDRFSAHGTLGYAFVEACQKGHTTLIDALRAYIPDLNAFEVLGATPLSIACERGLTDTIRMLLEMGAGIDAPIDVEGNTVLISACSAKNILILESLLLNGAAVNTRNLLGQTALSACCSRWSQSSKADILLRLITILVEHGADVNSCDNDGKTPLMSLLSGWQVEQGAVKLLLDYGADVTVRNAEGRTVFDILSDRADDSDSEHMGDDRLRALSALLKMYKESNRQSLESKPLLK